VAREAVPALLVLRYGATALRRYGATALRRRAMTARARPGSVSRSWGPADAGRPAVRVNSRR